jgi:protein YIPF1/2
MTDQSNTNNPIDDLNQGIGDEGEKEEAKYSFYQIEFYQRFFNVNTNEVLSRIVASMMPSINKSFLVSKIRPNPDLYGPFWIATTLVFSIAISGNIINFIQNFGTNVEWQTDFHKVTSSAAAIFTYWWLMPTLILLLTRWRNITTEMNFLEMLCIYGYSLFIYIPVSIIWLINVHWLQWIVVLVGALLSGNVLLMSFWPTFSQEPNKKVIIMNFILL